MAKKKISEFTTVTPTGTDKFLVEQSDGSYKSVLSSDIVNSITVDSTIIDGSTNAVSGNAVFDALALKLSNVINNISKLSLSGKYIPTKLGYGAVTATAGYGNGTYTCYKIEANDTINVTSLSVYVTTLFATGKIRLGIYSDNNGLVGTLIQQTAELDASSTGLKEGTITTTTLDKSTTYWLVIQQNSSVIGYYFNAVVLNDIFKTGDANGRFYYSAITYTGTYGSLPSTISGTPTYNLPAVGTNIVTFLKIA